MKNIICAANPLKEVLSASECLEALKSGAAVTAKAEEIAGFLVSDGGDGFLDAISQSRKMERIDVPCTAPLGDLITAPVVIDRETSTAFIESASCCGISLVDPERRSVLMSGTAGLADLLAAAKHAGVSTVYIGLGGTATCDGGVGFIWRLACLAGQFLQDACEPRVAIDLAESAAPDLEQIRNWLGDVQVIACVDVDNPLMGPDGAAQVYAPQKGATPEQVEQLEGWMGGWCQRIERNLGHGLCSSPGAGAAGGLGFALLAIGAQLAPGGWTVADITGIAAAIKPGMLVLTNEGRFDSTSFRGKAPWAIAQLARDAGASPAIFCAVADSGARARAEAEGVRIVEFARDLHEGERREKSAERLREAVAAYLQAEQEPA
jgi:glycerate kinase